MRPEKVTIPLQTLARDVVSEHPRRFVLLRLEVCSSSAAEPALSRPVDLGSQRRHGSDAHASRNHRKGTCWTGIGVSRELELSVAILGSSLPADSPYKHTDLEVELRLCAVEGGPLCVTSARVVGDIYHPNIFPNVGLSSYPSHFIPALCQSSHRIHKVLAGIHYRLRHPLMPGDALARASTADISSWNEDKDDALDDDVDTSRAQPPEVLVPMHVEVDVGSGGAICQAYRERCVFRSDVVACMLEDPALFEARARETCERENLRRRSFHRQIEEARLERTLLKEFDDGTSALPPGEADGDIRQLHASLLKAFKRLDRASTSGVSREGASVSPSCVSVASAPVQRRADAGHEGGPDNAATTTRQDRMGAPAAVPRRTGGHIDTFACVNDVSPVPMIDFVTESPTAGMRSSDSLLLMNDQSFGFGPRHQRRTSGLGELGEGRGNEDQRDAGPATVPPLVWLQMGKLFGQADALGSASSSSSSAGVVQPSSTSVHESKTSIGSDACAIVRRSAAGDHQASGVQGSACSGIVIEAVQGASLAQPICHAPHLQMWTWDAQDCCSFCLLILSRRDLSVVVAARFSPTHPSGMEKMLQVMDEATDECIICLYTESWGTREAKTMEWMRAMGTDCKTVFQKLGCQRWRPARGNASGPSSSSNGTSMKAGGRREKDGGGGVDALEDAAVFDGEMNAGAEGNGSSRHARHTAAGSYGSYGLICIPYLNQTSSGQARVHARGLGGVNSNGLCATHESTTIDTQGMEVALVYDPIDCMYMLVMKDKVDKLHLSDLLLGLNTNAGGLGATVSFRGMTKDSISCAAADEANATSTTAEPSQMASSSPQPTGPADSPSSPSASQSGSASSNSSSPASVSAAPLSHHHHHHHQPHLHHHHHHRHHRQHYHRQHQQQHQLQHHGGQLYQTDTSGLHLEMREFQVQAYLCLHRPVLLVIFAYYALFGGAAGNNNPYRMGSRQWVSFITDCKLNVTFVDSEHLFKESVQRAQDVDHWVQLQRLYQTKFSFKLSSIKAKPQPPPVVPAVAVATATHQRASIGAKPGGRHTHHNHHQQHTHLYRPGAATAHHADSDEANAGASVAKADSGTPSDKTMNKKSQSKSTASVTSQQRQGEGGRPAESARSSHAAMTSDTIRDGNESTGPVSAHSSEQQRAQRAQQSPAGSIGSHGSPRAVQSTARRRRRSSSRAVKGEHGRMDAMMSSSVVGHWGSNNGRPIHGGFDDADGGAASGAAKMSFEGEMGFDAFLEGIVRTSVKIYRTDDFGLAVRRFLYEKVFPTAQRLENNHGFDRAFHHPRCQQILLRNRRNLNRVFMLACPKRWTPFISPARWVEFLKVSGMIGNTLTLARALSFFVLANGGPEAPRYMRLRAFINGFARCAAERQRINLNAGGGGGGGGATGQHGKRGGVSCSDKPNTAAQIGGTDASARDGADPAVRRSTNGGGGAPDNLPDSDSQDNAAMAEALGKAVVHAIQQVVAKERELDL